MTVTPAEGGGGSGSGSGEGVSLQDRRKQLLEQQRQKKLEQQKAMGLTPASTGAPTQVGRIETRETVWSIMVKQFC